MSHLHLPDGILPLWLIISSNILAILLVVIFWLRKNDDDQLQTRKFALLGIFAALMLLAGSIQVPIILYHANLTIVTAIVLGPRLAILAAVIVNIMMALFGHGGITVLGLNSLIYILEMLAGYGLFKLFSRWRMSTAVAGFLAVFFALIISTTANFTTISLVSPAINAAISSGNFHHDHDHEEGANVSHGKEAAVTDKNVHEEHSHEEKTAEVDTKTHKEHLLDQAIGKTQINLPKLALLMFGFGIIGWLAEALLSSAMLTALKRTSPDMVPETGVNNGP